MKLFDSMRSYDYRSLLRHNETFVFLVLLAFSLAVTIINPSFLSIENLFDLAHSSSGMAILAIGVFVVLLSGGIDVSFTAVAISAQYIAVKTLINLNIDSLALAFLISCSVGITLGSVNAFLISIFRLPTLITTLGTLSFFHGGLLEFVGSMPFYTGQIPDCFKTFGLTKIISFIREDGTQFGLSVYVLIVLGVVLMTWVILRYTMLGRGIYAIGGNREAAERAGFNITRIQFFIYCYVGFLAGIMAIMHVSMIRYASPTLSIVGEELSVIAAVVLGGARITGGSGSLLGTLLGVALIVAIQKNLVLIGLSSYWHQFFVGLIIIVGVSITYYQSLRRSQRRVVFTEEL
jgi:simple sugar transport system permease protein